ncbi:hypothetical protein [Spirillospora sp. NPDC047279]|uniref:hypothetical protein n=1 Tax=Spirillospora sp. NPDC047279 TaxID=3155478 RepID=UPI0033C43D7C
MRAGLQLNERYRLVERLDDGGGAREVWRAWDDLLDRVVVVRTLGAITPGTRPVCHQRMSRAAGLTHAGIATIYDFDRTRDADGRPLPYLVTELLEGEVLAARIRRGDLSMTEALEACTQIAGALAAAHAGGVCHGNLGSGKVILASGGAKLVDLGMSPSAHEEDGPECAAADVAGMRADVHAFGAVLAECFGAVAAVRVPEAVARLSTRCRAPDSAARPLAGVIVEALARVRSASFDTLAFTAQGRLGPPAHAPVQATPPDAGTRKPWWALGVAGLFAAVTAGTAAVVAGQAPSRAALPMEDAATTARPAYSATAVPPPRPSFTVRPGVNANSWALDMLGRLRPIVERAFVRGEIRSDVAVDLGNVINDLRNDLLLGQQVDIGRRLAQLHEKITTRLREQGLSRDTAERLTRVLSTVPA